MATRSLGDLWPAIAAAPVVARMANGASLSGAAWCNRVSAWHARFRERQTQKVALFFEDFAEFSCALFGAWYAQKTVYLAGDNQPATQTRLSAFGCEFVQAPPIHTDLHATSPTYGFAGTRLHPETPRLVLFTSGSSGEPSLVSKNLRQLDAEIGALEAQFGATLEGCEIASSVSAQHIYGLLFCVLWPLCSARVFDTRRLAYSEQIPQRAADRRIALISSPAMLTRLNLPTTLCQSALVAVFSSGGKLEDAVAQSASALLGAPILEILGSTETGGIAWREHHEGLTASEWHVFEPVQWRELDGRLQLRSPYLPDPTQWFVSNDLVESVCERGFLHLGRADRIIKIEEKRLSLDAMEKHLRQFSGVLAAKAHILPELKRGLGMVCALAPELLLELRAGKKKSLVDALKQHLVTAFEPVVFPRRWRFVPELPSNSQGKTTHSALNALFEPREIPLIYAHAYSTRCELLLCPQAELLYFAGHFRQRAVLPGTVMLDWAIQLAAKMFNLSPKPIRVDALKFQRVVFPYHSIRLLLSHDDAKNAVNFSYESADAGHASGRLVYRSESAHG